MATFIYQARAISGKIMTGRLDAKDEPDAKIKLRARQLIPLKLTLVQGNQKKRGELEEALFKFMAPRITTKELKLFTRQFSTLINSGINIADCLRILSEGQISSLLKEALLQIRSSIEMGRRLSESMQQHDRVFDSLYINMIRAGEEAGIIDTILVRLSTYIEKNERIKQQVKSALVMPGVIVFVAVLVISGIMLFIIPKFKEIFEGSGKQLPYLTELVLSISDAFRSKWYLFFLLFGGSGGSLAYYITTEQGKKDKDVFLIRAPVIGDVVQKSAVARMSRTLSTLLGSGIGLLEAIDIAAKTSGNYVIEKALTECKDAVTSGKPFHVPLSRQKDLPMLVGQMVSIGEQSGSLDAMLGKVADFYEEEVENAVRAATQLIEPILMVGLGVSIAFIMIAMYLPVFTMGDTIGN
ncbi:MAG: type secretion system family protein [Pseudobdellovibrio sp.]|jgi:type IV pilus assembly protein PilC|nr:type secretion system family protein [Pseudobdellovibrio sp.]